MILYETNYGLYNNIHFERAVNQLEANQNANLKGVELI